MMTEENLACLRNHRNNIHRYRRLLGTQLTDLERQYIESRISEEMEAAKRLSNETFPLALRLPAQRFAEDDPLRSPEVWSWTECDLRTPSLPDRRPLRKTPSDRPRPNTPAIGTGQPANRLKLNGWFG
jgi:hypothetical protein